MATIHVRAPGRVNLIGEHTDYNGLAVLPMAIQRAIRIEAQPRADGLVRMTSTLGLPPREFQVAAMIAPFGEGDWGNYAKAAAEILAREYGIQRGMDAVVSGDIPQAAGLSSSSALVVANALALLAANGRSLPPAELAEVLARGERYVGTQGGGMDQAVCLCARAGAALKIDFFPLRTAAVPVPGDWRFVIAHCLVTAEKSAGAREYYNSKHRNCAEALRAVAARVGAGPVKLYPDLLGVRSAEELLEAAQGLEPRLMRAFRHVVTEGARVEKAAAAMRAGDYDLFGRLMIGSQASMRDDLGISIPELDELVQCALDGGAAGARLSGAGFGGCAVALCRAGQAGAIGEHLQGHYYRGRRKPQGIQEYLLVGEASSGASVRNGADADRPRG